MNAVYDFNRQASDSAVVRSLVCFALLVIPVYQVAFFVDWIVLNTLDFFNGTGGVADATLPDGSVVHMAKLEGDTVRVRHVDTNGRQMSFDIVRVGARAGYVRGPDGRIMGSVERLSDGRLIQQGR